MRTWLVAGAVIESATGLLLVQNRRRDGRTDWTTPGGVVDTGEGVLDGLSREVTEETGLVVGQWHDGPLYRIEAEAPDLGWHLQVEVHQAVTATGEIVLADPDGIVVDAQYLSVPDCSERLAGAPRWVRDPLVTWLEQRWSGERTFRYRIDGDRLDSLTVHDLDS